MNGSIADDVGFGILGPLEIHHAGQVLPIGSSRRRVVLAALLLRTNRVVPVDELSEIVWGDTPPSSARNALSVHVVQLRRSLGRGQGQAAALVWRSAGYMLQVDPDRVDWWRFQRLLGHAREARAAGALERAARDLHAAVGLWRGAALADVPSEWLQQAEAPRLEEARLGALQERVEVDLALGRHADLVGELETLVAAYPFRERLRGLLMLALCRSGQQSAALAVYRDTRRLLIEEQGLEPSADLKRLEHAILNADPLVEVPAPRPTSLPTSASEPPVDPLCQLPPDVADFTGRQESVRWLHDLLVGTTKRVATALTVSAVAGMAGVGKTSLAVRVAHQVQAAFPDGQLYVSLRGRQGRPLDPAEVLAGLLRDLGVAGAAIPASMEERSKLFRTRLAERRVLIVLDDAASEAQVRPLLPGAPACQVLVTSRRVLAGLEGANLLTLDVLEPSEAIELLGRLTGPGRVAEEPEAARRITRLCGHLPLAVRIAGARLAANRRWRLDELVQRLADERRRLGELRIGDLDVCASFALSYEGVDPSARRLFRLLGMLKLPDVPGWMAAALLDIELGAAAPVLEQLVEAQLVETVGYDSCGQLRYRLHDLLRVYAGQQLPDQGPADDGGHALQRALGAYVALAERAVASLRPGARQDAISAEFPRWSIHDLPAFAIVERDPSEWFRVEHRNLVDSVERAHAAGCWDHARALVTCLARRGPAP
jgi:DNA-binding SARP family transcriptional activator